jgi:hypothetical protein
MRFREDQVRALLDALCETHDVEIDCEEFLTLMAPYLEARIAGRPLTVELRKAYEHERFCANCREELAAVVETLAETKKR